MVLEYIKIDKPLAITNQKNKTYINSLLKSEMEECVITDLTNQEKFIKKYCEQLYVNKILK